jgi:integrase
MAHFRNEHSLIACAENYELPAHRRQPFCTHGHTSAITLNATLTGLKYFFDVTLDHSELMAKMKPVFVRRTLPVLSREEVSLLIAATRNLKHQTALLVGYGAGPRASEVAKLKVGDVDSARGTLRIRLHEIDSVATVQLLHLGRSACHRTDEVAIIG